MIGGWYVLPINPEPWAIGQVGVHRGKDNALGAHVNRNAQLASYQEAIRESIGLQPFITGPVKLTFYFWRWRADYKTPTARAARKNEADVTNLQKALEDALQGTLFANDREVNDIHSYLVDQGSDVVGLIIIHAEPSNLLRTVELPPDVIAESVRVVAPSVASDLSWPPKG